jgi:hypothetical protein
MASAHPNELGPFSFGHVKQPRLGLEYFTRAASALRANVGQGRTDQP